MIYNFEVEGFKGFEKKVIFDLSQKKNYEFNRDCIRDGIVDKSVIYGINGIGKSNLGLAIFDIVCHLTNTAFSKGLYRGYLNANNHCGFAYFKYSFRFGNDDVVYEYRKAGLNKIVSEKLMFNGVTVAEVDRMNDQLKPAEFDLPGTESLNTNVNDPQVSIINYIKNNAILADGKEKDIFLRLISFVDGMLYFRSLETNCYLGIEAGSSLIGPDIVKRSNIKDFERFLKIAGINYDLCSMKRQGDESIIDDLAVRFDDGNILPFFTIASTGTRSLALFYFWLQRIRDDGGVSFVFIDEFDAFYHHGLSMQIVKEVKKFKAQTIMTTHNTTIMTNELMRPDCYYIISSNGMAPLSDLTDRELREAHNIEKMYKAGTFGSLIGEADGRVDVSKRGDLHG